MSVGSRGKFIVLEGIDGAGTTTQLHRLTAWLEGEGMNVHPTFEPSDGEIGLYIRKILRGEAGTTNPEAVALMFAADRLDHINTEIQPRLDAGFQVLCDRYIGSSLAYQGSHCDPDWVRRINRYAIEPDVVIYVRVDVDTAMARLKQRDGDKAELFEKKDSLVRISEAYDRVYGVAGEPELSAHIVDGTQNPTRVFMDCCRVIRGNLDR